MVEEQPACSSSGGGGSSLPATDADALATSGGRSCAGSPDAAPPLPPGVAHAMEAVAAAVDAALASAPASERAAVRCLVEGMSGIVALVMATEDKEVAVGIVMDALRAAHVDMAAAAAAAEAAGAAAGSGAATANNTKEDRAERGWPVGKRKRSSVGMMAGEASDVDGALGAAPSDSRGVIRARVDEPQPKELGLPMPMGPLGALGSSAAAADGPNGAGRLQALAPAPAAAGGHTHAYLRPYVQLGQPPVVAGCGGGAPLLSGCVGQGTRGHAVPAPPPGLPVTAPRGIAVQHAPPMQGSCGGVAPVPLMHRAFAVADLPEGWPWGLAMPAQAATASQDRQAAHQSGSSGVYGTAGGLGVSASAMVQQHSLYRHQQPVSYLFGTERAVAPIAILPGVQRPSLLLKHLPQRPAHQLGVQPAHGTGGGIIPVPPTLQALVAGMQASGPAQQPQGPPLLLPPPSHL